MAGGHRDTVPEDLIAAAPNEQPRYSGEPVCNRCGNALLWLTLKEKGVCLNCLTDQAWREAKGQELARLM